MAETPVAPDPKKERIDALELRIGVVEDNYIKWWGDPSDQNSNLMFLKETAQRAELQLEPMDLNSLDEYSSEMSSKLATINGYVPVLEKYHSTVKGLVAQVVSLRGHSGFPYKDMVEGDERVAALWESVRMADRLSASITHQLKNIDSRNFRIGQEIKSGIWTGNPNSGKAKTPAPSAKPASTKPEYP